MAIYSTTADHNCKMVYNCTVSLHDHIQEIPNLMTWRKSWSCSVMK